MSLQFALLRKSKTATFRVVDVVTVTVAFVVLFECTLEGCKPSYRSRWGGYS